MKYYIALNGQQTGPFEVNELLAHGLTPSTLVWHEGMAQWAAASTVPELAPLFQQQQPYGQQQATQQPQPPYGEPQQAGFATRVQPQIGFWDAVKTAFNKYATFSGRARRSELWYFVLFNLVVSCVLSVISTFIGDTYNILSWLYALAVLIPNLAIAWRRLHDIGKAGGWYFIGLIPLVGWIFVLVWYCTDSEKTANRFGPSPKYN